MHTVCALCPRRWGPILSLSSTVASMCLAAPFNSLWGHWAKAVLIRCGPEVQGWSEVWPECQVRGRWPRVGVGARQPARWAVVLKSHPCPASLSPAEFSIWTREAGAGGLSIAVEGPSKAEIAFEDRKDGSCGVSYVVQEPGGCLRWGWSLGLPDLPKYLLINQAGGGWGYRTPPSPGPLLFLCPVSSTLHPWGCLSVSRPEP